MWLRVVMVFEYAEGELLQSKLILKGVFSSNSLQGFSLSDHKEFKNIYI